MPGPNLIDFQAAPAMPSHTPSQAVAKARGKFHPVGEELKSVHKTRTVLQNKPNGPGTASSMVRLSLAMHKAEGDQAAAKAQNCYFTTIGDRRVLASNEVLGKGSNGQVRSGWTAEGAPCAIKQGAISEKEVALLEPFSRKESTRICRIHTSDDHTVIMERGIPLPRFLELNENIPEHVRHQFIEDMLESVVELEQEHIAHRDIKLENFIVVMEKGKYRLKLIDFGEAASVVEGQTRDIGLGTPLFFSPTRCFSYVSSQPDRAPHHSDLWAIMLTIADLNEGYWKSDDFANDFSDYMQVVVPLQKGVMERTQGDQTKAIVMYSKAMLRWFREQKEQGRLSLFDGKPQSLVERLLFRISDFGFNPTSLPTAQQALTSFRNAASARPVDANAAQWTAVVKEPREQVAKGAFPDADSDEELFDSPLNFAL